MVSYLLVAGLIFFPSLWFLRRSLASSLEQAELRDLKGRVEAVRYRLAAVPDADLDRVLRDTASLLGLRITYIDRAGVVKSDSDLPLDRVVSMENHRTRKEVLAALAGSLGYDRRLS